MASRSAERQQRGLSAEKLGIVVAALGVAGAIAWRFLPKEWREAAIRTASGLTKIAEETLGGEHPLNGTEAHSVVQGLLNSRRN